MKGGIEMKIPTFCSDCEDTHCDNCGQPVNQVWKQYFLNKAGKHPEQTRITEWLK